jgi:hypothetical protein
MLRWRVLDVPLLLGRLRMVWYMRGKERLLGLRWWRVHIRGLSHGLRRGYRLRNILLGVSGSRLVWIVCWLSRGRDWWLDGRGMILLMLLLLLLLLLLALPLRTVAIIRIERTVLWRGPWWWLGSGPLGIVADSWGLDMGLDVGLAGVGPVIVIWLSWLGRGRAWRKGWLLWCKGRCRDKRVFVHERGKERKQRSSDK